MNYEYITAIFKESLRMTPPAPALAERIVAKDMEICDMTIKKGDSVMVFFSLLGMDPEIFKNHEKFDPERFMRNRDKEKYPEIPRLQQIPFSYGQRNCIGQVLAEVMVKTIIIEFFRVFDLTILEGWEPKMMIQPTYGIQNAEFDVGLRK